MFFNEYAGQKTKLQLSLGDSLLNNSILQFDSSFGVVTHSIKETNAVDAKFSNSQKLLTTTFYVYTDGTLEAPTSTLFFQPKNPSSVSDEGMLFGLNNFISYYFFSEDSSQFRQCEVSLVIIKASFTINSRFNNFCSRFQN